MARRTTSAGKLKVNLAVDPEAYELLRQMAEHERGVGALIGELAFAEARRRQEEELHRAQWRAFGGYGSDLQGALARLEASEARYNRLVSRLSAVVFEVTPDGTLLFCNDAAIEATGFRPEELLGQGWRELLFPDSLSRDFEVVLQEWQQGDSQRRVVEVATRSGRIATGELSTANHYAPDGTLELIVGFWVDITERRKAEAEREAALEALAETAEQLGQARDELEIRVQERTRELAERQHFIERVAATTPHFWYVYDLVDRQVIWSNHRLSQLLRYPPDHVELAPAEFLRTRLHPEDQYVWRNPRGRFAALADGQILESEYRLRAADDEWHWFYNRDTVFERDHEGAPRQILGLIQDITARKRAELQREAALRRLERAKALSEALNRINAAINSPFSFDEIINRALDESMAATGADSASVTLCEGRTLVFKYTRGMTPEMVGFAIDSEQAPIARQVLETGQPVVVGDSFRHPTLNGEALSSVAIQTVLAVPILRRAAVIGVLYLNIHHTTSPVGEEEIRFAEQLASALALALENARLYEEAATRKDADGEAALDQVSITQR